MINKNYTIKLRLTSFSLVARIFENIHDHFINIKGLFLAVISLAGYYYNNTIANVIDKDICQVIYHIV